MPKDIPLPKRLAAPMAKLVSSVKPLEHTASEILDWEWSEALRVWSEDRDIEPLLTLLEAMAAVGSPLRIDKIKSLIGVIRILNAKQQKRPRGKPPGRIRLWQDPSYVAALVAEVRIGQWKRNHEKANIPPSRQTEIIVEVVDQIRVWNFVKRKRPSVDRVRALLRGPKSRRL